MADILTREERGLLSSIKSRDVKRINRGVSSFPLIAESWKVSNTMKAPSNRRKQKFARSNKKDARVLELHGEGLSIDAIAKDVRLSEAAVQKRIERLTQ